MRTGFFVLFLCMIGVGLWGQSASQLLAQAKAEANPQTQIKLLTRAVAKAPRLADAYHYRGDAYRSLGKQKQALADYSRTVSLRPKDPFRYYARALLYLDMGRASLAVSDLSKAISLKPGYRNFYLARARAFYALGKAESSVKDYKKYLRSRTPSPELALEIAQAYLGAYQYTQAHAQLDLAQQSGKDDAEFHYWRGRVYTGQHRLDEAISSYSKAINRDQNYAQAYRYRASAFKELKDLPASLQDYTVLLRLQPDALFYNRRGLVYEEMKKFREAASDYSKAIDLNPKWAIPYNNRGFARMNLKDWASAQKDLETAIKLDGATPTPYVNLAGVYWLGKKDRKKAYQNLDKAVRLNFKNFESLFDEEQKGWMFKGLNKTAEFRSLLYR